MEDRGDINFLHIWGWKNKCSYVGFNIRTLKARTFSDHLKDAFVDNNLFLSYDVYIL